MSPSTATVAQGQSQQLTATARDVAGNSLQGVTFIWASSQPSVASVDAQGRLVVASSAPIGTTVTITATSGSKAGTAAIAVGSANGLIISKITGDNTSCDVNTFCLFFVRVTNSAGVPVQGQQVRWAMPSAGAITVVTVTDAQGVASATNVYKYDGPISTYMTATLVSSGQTVTFPFQVVTPTLNISKVAGDSQSCIINTFTCQFSVRVTNSAGAGVAGQQIRWAMPDAGATTRTVVTDASGYASQPNVYTYNGPTTTTQTATLVSTGASVSFAIRFVTPGSGSCNIPSNTYWSSSAGEIFWNGTQGVIVVPPASGPRFSVGTVMWRNVNLVSCAMEELLDSGSYYRGTFSTYSIFNNGAPPFAVYGPSRLWGQSRP